MAKYRSLPQQESPCIENSTVGVVIQDSRNTGSMKSASKDTTTLGLWAWTKKFTLSLVFIAAFDLHIG